MAKIKTKKILIFLLCVTMAASSALALTGCRQSDKLAASDSSAEQTSGETGGSEDADGDEARLASLREAEDKGLLVLVNKENPVTSGYYPQDLGPIYYYATDRDPQWRYMRQEAADAFNLMVEAARADGIDFVMTTAYRSYDFQTVLWNNAVARKGSEEAANMTSARPGQSEHQTGLAVDVSSAENNYQLTENFGSTEAGKWLAAHCAEHGFIIRYPADKTDITGYAYEPWHFRYVGVTAATEIMDRGITLEEYLADLDI